jgi:hypothetical protein
MAKRINAKSPKPENRSGRTQTLSSTAPAATSVQLVGEFTHWQQRPINLQKGADDTWNTRVEFDAGPQRLPFSGAWPVVRRPGMLGA